MFLAGPLRNSFHHALWRQTWKKLRCLLFPSPREQGLLFAWVPSSVPCAVPSWAPCAAMPPRHLRAKPADGSLCKTRQLRARRREKRGEWNAIPHPNLRKSHIYLCIFGLWMQTISYSFKPFFFLRCVIEEEDFFT